MDHKIVSQLLARIDDLQRRVAHPPELDAEPCPACGSHIYRRTLRRAYVAAGEPDDTQLRCVDCGAQLTLNVEFYPVYFLTSEDDL